jgi:hypothetical protein
MDFSALWKPALAVIGIATIANTAFAVSYTCKTNQAFNLKNGHLEPATEGVLSSAAVVKFIDIGNDTAIIWNGYNADRGSGDQSVIVQKMDKHKDLIALPKVNTDQNDSFFRLHKDKDDYSFMDYSGTGLGILIGTCKVKPQ